MREARVADARRSGWPGAIFHPAVLAVASVTALITLIVVLWLAPESPNAQTTAARALAAALGAAGDDVGARVAETLPVGAKALVHLPAVQHDMPDPESSDVDRSPVTSAVNQSVTVARGQVDRAATVDHYSLSSAVATAIDPGGSWVAITVPSSGGGFTAALPALAAALVAGSGALAAGALRRPRAATPRPVTIRHVDPAPAPAPPAAPDPRLNRLVDQRDALVLGLAELVSQMPEALVWQATNTLQAAGVRVIAPDGEQFDPDVHHAAATEATTEASLVGTVARTLRPGYMDGNRTVVYPRVVVYAEPPAEVEP